ncbi:MAG: hypothetical protein JW829_04130 [Pirellulales bacterium]|nr:hypothetical protein [Pirellulales bacterium]
MNDAQPNHRMTRPIMTALAAAVCLMISPAAQAGDEKAAPSIQYVPLDAPSGMSQAVLVDRMPLVHTRQLFPLDTEGKLVGPDSADVQIEQVLSNLEAVLKTAGSGLDRLIRLNVYALSNETADRVRQLLDDRLDDAVRPAITSVLTPLPDREVLVAVDAVAGSASSGQKVALKRCPQVAGDDRCADAAVLPAGDIAYLSGMPQPFELTALPTTKSMALLMDILQDLKLTPEHVVQVKVFVNPVTSAKEVLEELRAFFPGQRMPPVVFVEWLASVPVEIELIAQLPPSGRPAAGVQYYNPPQYRPSNTFSRVALMRADRQIYLSGLYANKPSRGEPQADLLFGRLAEVLEKTGSDMRHLVKATYYVSDHDAARWVDRTRPKIFDPLRPPAASKLMVHGVARAERTLTVDMIAVQAQ